LVRPGAESFLQEVAKYYEVVIFTAALQDYADSILDELDKEGCISYRLYRQHALPYEGNYIKDLSRVGRALHKMIIVDNLAENFQFQSENGIMIKTWVGDPKDTALFELAPILKGLVCLNNHRDRYQEGR
jgi:CTD small phosphatase-like protein 2